MASFRGKPACTCLAKWLPVYEAELLRLGEIKHSLDIYQLVGGASASAGTHAGGGAFDDGQYSDKAIQIAREMGAAKWKRTRAQGFDITHGHGVLNGCPHAAPSAKRQVASYKSGRNGLANNGIDDGPRARQFPTWEAGIKWAKTRQAAWIKPAAKPKPVTTRTTTLEVATLNMRGKTSGFPARVPVINTRVRLHLPHFLACQELPPAARTLVSLALRTKYKMSSNYANKVQYVLNNSNGWVEVKSAKYQLGNNRHAVAVRYRHRNSGADYVLVTPHLSWEHGDGNLRAAETRTLIAHLNRDFGRLPKLIASDLNDSHKDTKSRPDDSSGDVLKAAGFHDLYYDVPTAKKSGREYNTAHQNKTPIPKSGIHIDRFWGTAEFEGLTWTNDVHTGRRASDHWLVQMSVRLTHPVKK